MKLIEVTAQLNAAQKTALNTEIIPKLSTATVLISAEVKPSNYNSGDTTIRICGEKENWTFEMTPGGKFKGISDTQRNTGNLSELIRLTDIIAKELKPENGWETLLGRWNDTKGSDTEEDVFDAADQLLINLMPSFNFDPDNFSPEMKAADAELSLQRQRIFYNA